MPVNLISEDDLRSALCFYRVDPHAFEAGVRTRFEAAPRPRFDEPWASLSPFLRSAAAFLPLEIFTASKATPATVASAAGGYKLLGYLTFPAISLFVLLGATLFSVSKIRNLQQNKGAGLSNEQALRQWWSQNKWGAYAVFATTIILSLVGAAWLLFLLYIVSFGLLLYVLSTFAKLGLGNRQMIAQSCLMGLMFLGQVAMFAGIGVQDIHFLDQTLVGAVFFGGVMALLPFVMGSSPLDGIYKSKVGQRNAAYSRRLAAGFMVVLVVPLMAWMMNPILWPATPTRIKHYVESFNRAPHATVSWQRWEIVTSWAIQSELDTDLSQPRRLLATEIAGDQNPFILGSALRIGLLPADQLGQLKAYQEQRRYLLQELPNGMQPQVISSLDQLDWVIRAAALRNDLSPQERDLLEQRLHATLESLSDSPQAVLSEVLRATQLLDVIDRPVDRNQYRDRVHHLLRRFHTKSGGGFQFAGGFKNYLNWPAGSWFAQPGSLEPTSHAIELMAIYGVPDNLDVNWVRAFLRPSVYRISDDKWVAAATLERLNHLPGATQPTWLEFLYYERTLLTAAILVGLCLYATLCSPQLKAATSEDRLA